MNPNQTVNELLSISVKWKQWDNETNSEAYFNEWRSVENSNISTAQQSVSQTNTVQLVRTNQFSHGRSFLCGIVKPILESWPKAKFRVDFYLSVYMNLWLSGLLVLLQIASESVEVGCKFLWFLNKGWLSAISNQKVSWANFKARNLWQEAYDKNANRNKLHIEFTVRFFFFF